jgi:hypothetical protein
MTRTTPTAAEGHTVTPCLDCGAPAVHALCTACIAWHEALHFDTAFADGQSAYDPDMGECSGCGDLFCTCAE